MYLRSRPWMFALLICATSIGCAEGPSEIPQGAKPITIQPIPEEQPLHFQSGIPTRQRLVIRDSSTWASMWLDIVGSVSPAPPTPKIDFASHLVLVAAMGTQPSGGYTIAIDDVRTMNDDVWISVTETLPGDRCAVPAVITAPVSVVAVPRFSGKATFVEHTAVHDCRD